MYIITKVLLTIISYGNSDRRVRINVRTGRYFNTESLLRRLNDGIIDDSYIATQTRYFRSESEHKCLFCIVLTS